MRSETNARKGKHLAVMELFIPVKHHRMVNSLSFGYVCVKMIPVISRVKTKTLCQTLDFHGDED
jgi:hypothetical protein